METNPTPRTRGAGSVRPGSMTAVMRAVETPRVARGPRWLRFAIVRDGRIVHEQTLSPDKTLSAGQSGDISIDAPTREIASCHEGVWRLRVAPHWRGRTAEGELSELPAEEASDGWRTLTLRSQARAKVELDGCSVLLQVVRPPPVRTQPRLPAALEQGLFERADWAFTAFVAGSFMLHFAAIAYLMEADWPVEPGIADRVAVVIYPEDPMPPDPPDVTPETTSPDAETGETVEETVVADNSADTSDHANPDASPRRRRNNAPPQPSLSGEEAREIAAAQAIVLGALLGNGTMGDLARSGAPTHSQADLIAQVEGVQPPGDGPNTLPAERTGSSGCAGCDRDLGRLQARATRGPLDEGPPREERIITIVQGAPAPSVDPVGDDIYWDPRELHRTLGARMSAVRRCYETEITHGTVQGGGRITLTMQVMPVGTLAQVRAVENTTGSSTLADCAIRVARGVRVRGGPSSPMTVRYPIVFSRQE